MSRLDDLFSATKKELTIERDMMVNQIKDELSKAKVKALSKISKI
jgi:hypothetical protein